MMGRSDGSDGGWRGCGGRGCGVGAGDVCDLTV